MTFTHASVGGIGCLLRRTVVAFVAAVIACAALAVTAPGAVASGGRLDSTFGNDQGLELASTGISGGAPEVYSPAIGDPSETAVLSGGGFPVFRLTMFAADGRTVVADNLGASSAAVQNVTPVALVPMADGLYMAVGREHASDGSNQIVLGRFNANGSPDGGFGLQVVPETQCPGHAGGPGFGNIPTAAAFNGNRVVVVGSCGLGAGVGEQPAAWEFNEQGQLLATHTLVSVTANSLPPGFSTEDYFHATAITAGRGSVDYVVGDFAGTRAGKDTDRIFLAKYVQGQGFDWTFGDSAAADPANAGYELFGLGAAMGLCGSLVAVRRFLHV